GRKWVEDTASFPAFVFWKTVTSQPALDSSAAEADTSGNLGLFEASLMQFHDLLIAVIALGTPSQTYSLLARTGGRFPVGQTDTLQLFDNWPEHFLGRWTGQSVPADVRAATRQAEFKGLGQVLVQVEAIGNLRGLRRSLTCCAGI